MDNLTKFIKFLEKLEDKNIYYKLNKIREDSIMVEVTIPGQRWEIEYNTYDNGSNYIIEIENSYNEKQDLNNNSRKRILDMQKKLKKVKNGDYE